MELMSTFIEAGLLRAMFTIIVLFVSDQCILFEGPRKKEVFYLKYIAY